MEMISKTYAHSDINPVPTGVHRQQVVSGITKCVFGRLI